MKKKIILSILTVASILSADVQFGQMKIKLPVLNINYLSVEHGGAKSMIDAYSDGVGVVVIGNPGIKADNEAINKLVFKYGEKAKQASINLPDYVLADVTASAEDIALAQKIKDDLAVSQYIPDGTPCDDGNPNTSNDIYTNGVCTGKRIFDFNVIWENYKGNVNIVYLNPSDGSEPYTFGIRISGEPVVQATGVSIQELKNYGYSQVSFFVSSSSNGVVGYCYDGNLIAYEFGKNFVGVPFEINLDLNSAYIGPGYGTPEYNIDLTNYDLSLFTICTASIQSDNGKQLWSNFSFK